MRYRRVTVRRYNAQMRPLGIAVDWTVQRACLQHRLIMYKCQITLIHLIRLQLLRQLLMNIRRLRDYD
ncbi:hypothetical protein D3C84_1028370 [compost metagenome]